MEPLVFATIAMLSGLKRQETYVPEPAEFRPFDLRALRRSYEAEDDSSSSPTNRPESLVNQIAS
jgi:hypothetical protein